MGNCIGQKHSCEDNVSQKIIHVIEERSGVEQRLSDSLVDFLELFPPIHDWKNRNIDYDAVLKPLETCRIASWNLNRLSLSKARHPAYLEAIVATIILSNADVIFLQEIKEPDAVTIIVEELNNPKIAYIKKLSVLSKYKWRCLSSKEHLGRMYQGNEFASIIYRDYGDVLQVRNSSVLNEENRSFSRSPFMVEIKFNSKRILAISVHLKAVSLKGDEGKTSEEIRLLSCLAKAAIESFKSDRSSVILIGDFNMASTHEAFKELRDLDFMPIFNEQKTSISSLVNSANKTGGEYDNCWLNGAIRKQFKDAGILYKSISNPFIFENDWGGYASDHALIYFDF